jgi:alanine dehydrogenase
MSATGTSFGAILPALAERHRVISIEQQAHGHTAAIDRPLRIPTMARDTAAVLHALDIDRADVLGYCMGAGVALQLALDEPALVGRLALVSITHDPSGFHPGLMAGLDQLTPDQVRGSPWHTEYLSIAPCVRFAEDREVFDQDVVVVVRCPDETAIRWMRPGSILVTMLHFPTRPARARLLEDAGVQALSLDSVVDDTGHRLVENLESVGWNGVEAAFQELGRIHPNYSHPSRRPLRVTCLGAGAVGGHAVRAATRYGDPRIREEMVANNVPGVEVTVVDFDLTWHEDYMLGRLERTDLLIDATGRLDTSVPVIPNRWLAALPHEAVILDLSSDPYLPEADPPMVKGIEGVPQGDLDRYVFPVDHPAWDAQPSSIDTTNRRLALSCYAWPGIHPRRCMEVYGSQIEPLMTIVLTTPMEAWDERNGPHDVRAAARGALARWRTTVDD